MENGNGAGNGDANMLTAEELALYDRQIRCWGFEAQNRLRNSNVLLYGMSLLGAEVGKNLMLCGLNGLTVADSAIVAQEEENIFFNSETAAGKNRAEASYDSLKVLNPNVRLETLIIAPENLNNEFVHKFDLVILIDQVYDTITKVNDICRRHKIRFIAGGVFGFVGYSFFDFNDIDFLVEVKSNDKLFNEDGRTEGNLITIDDTPATTKEKIAFSYNSFVDSMVLGTIQDSRRVRRQKPETYVLLNSLIQLHQKCGAFPSAEQFSEFLQGLDDPAAHDYLKRAVQNDSNFITNPPPAATSSVVGGVLAQEAIKSLCQDGKPYKNFFGYSALDAMGYVYDLPMRLE